VQPSSSVDIRSKVDGEFQRCCFTEGQHVKKETVSPRSTAPVFRLRSTGQSQKAQDEADLIAVEKTSSAPRL